MAPLLLFLRSEIILYAIIAPCWGVVLALSIMFWVWFMLRVSFPRPRLMFVLFFLLPFWFPWSRPWTVGLGPWMYWPFLSHLVFTSWPWSMPWPLFAPWPVSVFVFLSISAPWAVTSPIPFLSSALSLKLPGKVVSWRSRSPSGWWMSSSIWWPWSSSIWRPPWWSWPTSSWWPWPSLRWRSTLRTSEIRRSKTRKFH